MGWKLTAAVVIAASGGAWAAAGDASNGALAVRTPSGVEVFRITDTGQVTSPAERINNDLADKAGSIPDPTPGYTFTSGVVVRAVDDTPMREIAGFGYVFAPIEAAPGFFLVSGRTVDDAIWAADLLASDPRVSEAYLDISRPKELRTLPTDPHFGNQWHLNNTTNPIIDVNAEPAWDAGYTGQGEIVGVLESGWEITHSDLSPNYNATASQPDNGLTTHGTSVAGVIAAQDNNGLGGVGVAYDAQISRLYYGTDTETATAFGYRNDLNDIKNNSWGPSDNGALHDISSVELTALKNAYQTGRGGLGEVFAWAAGNGGTGDRVEYDPYASSRYVTPFGAVGDADTRAYYNELGSAHLVVTQSNGNGAGIYTTAYSNTYTSSFGGTSSASPLGAGVVALMMQANPNLTVRDIDHILINSARKVDPGDPDWTVNGAGHDVSYDYGYGAVDAGTATAMAATWTNVGPEVSASAFQSVELAIPDNDATGITQNVVMPDDILIEHIELVMNVTHTYVGDLEIVMTSPMGTESIVSAAPRGDSRNDLVNYVFTSRRHWDEASAGTWTVKVADRASADTGTWHNFEIYVYGTALAGPCSPADVTTTGAGVGDPGYGVPDGAITTADIQYYVNLFVSGDPAADLTTTGAGSGDPGYGVPDGSITAADIQYYVNLWIAGCP